VPEAEVTLLGVVVGGSGGGVGPGQTDTFSEVVREEDGSCAGWASPGAGGSWTSGVRAGADVKVYDAARGGHLLGTGALAPGKADDVDAPNGQWQCDLAFGVQKVKRAPGYFVQVDSLARVEGRVGPGGALVVPLSTPARASMIGSCADVGPPTPSAPAPSSPAASPPDASAGSAPVGSGPVSSGSGSSGSGSSGSGSSGSGSSGSGSAGADPAEPVGEWQSVGSYWSQGLASVCGAGLRVKRIERVCRPAHVATDRIVAVVEAGTGDVLEDAAGLHLEGQQVTSGTEVVVRVTTAYPC